MEVRAGFFRVHPKAPAQNRGLYLLVPGTVAGAAIDQLFGSGEKRPGVIDTLALEFQVRNQVIQIVLFGYPLQDLPGRGLDPDRRRVTFEEGFI